MSLEKYIQKMDITNCPGNCKFKNKTAFPIILIPPPSEIKLVIVSRDPTIGFIPIYEYSRRFESKELRKMLFLNGIPINMINKVIVFMEKEPEKTISEDDKRILFDIVLNNAYWTHLHKCPTDFNNNPFKKAKNKKEREESTICAEQWLKEEIKKAIDDGAQYIIALGKDVQNWLTKQKEYKKLEDKIINLPHPSGRNDDLWYRSPKTKKGIVKCEENIKKLLSNLRKVI